MSKLQIFNFEQEQFRTYVEDSGTIWFHVVDVCKILKLSNPARIVNTVIADYCRKWSLGGDGRPANFTTEPGFYALIFESKTPQAHKLQKHVFEDILPAIRKEGGFVSPTVTVPQAIALKSEIDRIIGTPSPWELFYSQPVRDKFVGWFGVGFYWDFCYHWLTAEERCLLERVNGDRANRIHQHLSPEAKARLEPHVELLLNVADGFSDRQIFVDWYQGKYGKGWQLALPLA